MMAAAAVAHPCHQQQQQQGIMLVLVLVLLVLLQLSGQTLIHSRGTQLSSAST
jgi:Tfp pilus assembly protein PilX